MTALILVDMQNDFFPGGALEVKEGDKILTAVNQLLELPFDTFVATKDWHPLSHVSFASTHKKKPGTKVEIQGINQTLWPDHCIANTHGADYAPGWAKEKVEKKIFKGTDPDIDSYSTFFDNGHHKKTGLDEWLKNKNIKILFIVGLATDYCVKFSALDAVELGYNVYVVKEGCKGVNLHPQDVSAAYELMEQKGVKVISLQTAVNLLKGLS